MADGTPKDYSSMYCEDSGTSPPPPHCNNNNLNISNNNNIISLNNGLNSNNNNNHTSSLTHKQPPIPSSRGLPKAPYNKLLDGSFVAPRHREQQLDTTTTSVCLRQVVAKLANLPKENHRAYAIDTLNKHYSTVFVNRRKTSFKAYIQYVDEKDTNTYVVRVDQNTLRAIKDKMPKRGNYRYFFKGQENTCEEVEFDESVVPFHEKDGLRQIYCQVFPF